jgi:hypothetical protein
MLISVYLSSVDLIGQLSGGECHSTNLSYEGGDYSVLSVFRVSTLSSFRVSGFHPQFLPCFGFLSRILQREIANKPNSHFGVLTSVLTWIVAWI